MVSKTAQRKLPGGKGGSVTQQTASRLLELIFAGVYPPGSNLREMRIAKEFGVSQAAVREALQQLESVGLVSRAPNVGTTVTRLSPKEVRERVELRAALEISAAKQAASTMTEEDFCELERRLERLGQTIKKNSYYDSAQADLDFHRHIWACSGNGTLKRVLEQLTVPLLAFVSVLRATGLQRLSDVVQEHEPLVTAMRSRDPDVIEEVFSRAAFGSYEEFMDVTASSRRALAFGVMASADERAGLLVAPER